MATDPQPPTLDELCAQALKLPCSPSLLPRLTAVLQNPDATTDEIERLIALDAALAAATLRMANSAYYAAEPVEALEQAVARLGMKEIYRLASLVLVGRWEAVHQKNLRWEPGDYARHSLCTALGAEVLAEATGRVDPQIAYTAGLVCDIGKLAVAYVCAPFYPAVFKRSQDEGLIWNEAEKAVFGYNNLEVTSKLLRSWRFPDHFAQAIEGQTDPSKASADVLPLLSHLHAAKYLAISLGPGVTEEGFLFSVHGAFLDECGFTSEALQQAMIEVEARAYARLGEKFIQGSIGT